MTKEKESKTEQTENIYTALLKVQAGDWLVKKESSNPYFKSKYADLESVSQVCRKALNENGVVLTQLPVVIDGLAGCETRLTHAASNSSIENTLLLPLAKQDAQAVGSCITYARRYALCSLLGLVAADEDDDGNAASSKPIETKDRELNKGGSWPTVSGKKYPLGKKDEGFKKEPLANDDIPEFEAVKAVFPDSEEIKIRFKYDIDNVESSKIEAIESYIQAQKQNGYVDLDQTTGVIESELELPKLKRYQIFPD